MLEGSMPAGTPVGRAWVVILRNGAIAIDWGDGLFQDVMSGDFSKVTETQVSHRAQDAELDWLARAGLVSRYDAQQVYFINLPEYEKGTLE
jgi:hypothetical protein